MMSRQTKAHENAVGLGAQIMQERSCPYQYDDDGTCNYCGSIEPEKAIEFLKNPGSVFSGSDWKYGWPHKFYIDTINPDAAQSVEIGSDSVPRGEEPLPTDRWSCFAHHNDGCSCPNEPGVTGSWRLPIMSHRTSLHFKFYSKHLKDCTPEVLAQFNELSRKCFGIVWTLDEKGLRYRCPNTEAFHGWQRYGQIEAGGRITHKDGIDSERVEAILNS